MTAWALLSLGFDSKALAVGMVAEGATVAPLDDSRHRGNTWSFDRRAGERALELGIGAVRLWKN